MNICMYVQKLQLQGNYSDALTEIQHSSITHKAIPILMRQRYIQNENVSGMSGNDGV